MNAGAAPIVMATLGETLTEKAGVVNLSLDGTILLAAMAGFVVALKTGSLFIACAVEAALLSGCGPTERAALRAYAKNLGLAFQITDDLLDAVGDPETLGKDHAPGADGANFVTFAGVEGSRRLAVELIDTAVQSLAPLGRRGATLEAIARYVVRRET